MTRTIVISALILAGACTTTPVIGSGGSNDVSAAAVSTPQNTTNFAAELSATSARGYIDRELQQIEASKPPYEDSNVDNHDSSGRPPLSIIYRQSFLENLLTHLQVPADFEVYREIRDLTLDATLNLPSRTGDRYYGLTAIGIVAHEAGDRETGARVVELRRDLVRARVEADNWSQVQADVITGISKEEAWLHTARDAAQFGDISEAISIISEAYPEHSRDDFILLSELAAVHLAADDYARAEELAAEAIRERPYRWGEERLIFADREIASHLILIESLARQDKSTDNAVDKLKRVSSGFPTYLSGHAFNFYVLAQQMAPYAPEHARAMLAVGQSINEIADGGESFPFRTIEADACRELFDDACLLHIAQEQEAALEDDDFLISLVAAEYASAGDLESTNRLLRHDGGYICDPFAHQAAIQRLVDRGETEAATRWLEKWVACLAERDPNFVTGFGEGGNLWAWIARGYAQLARRHLELSEFEGAEASSQLALEYAIQAETTWSVEYGGYRAAELGQAFGAALGALVAVENGRSSSAAPKSK